MEALEVYLLLPMETTHECDAYASLECSQCWAFACHTAHNGSLKVRHAGNGWKGQTTVS